jgi:ATP-dependent Lon protease
MAELSLDFTIPDLLPRTLPVLALRKGVLLPGGVMPLTVGRRRSVAALDAAKGGLILVAPQREPVDEPSPSDLLPVATIARVIRSHQDARGVRQIVVQGLCRAQLTGFPSSHPALEAVYTRADDRWPETTEARAMLATFRDAAVGTADVVGQSAQARALLDGDVPPEILVDAVASLLQESDDWKKALLQTRDPLSRAERVLVALTRLREVLSARKSIQDRVQNETQQQQREYVLRQQLKAIQEELGEGDDDDLSRLKQRLEEADLPEEVRKVVDRELRRLERLSGQSPERSVALDWMSWIADFPWNTESAVDIDLDALEKAMDASHHGLADVKRQVVEHLAVRKLAGRGRADVLLLVGPPGVG